MFDSYVALQFQAWSDFPYMLSVLRSCDSSLNVQLPFLVDRVYGKVLFLLKMPHAALSFDATNLPSSLRQPTSSVLGDALRQSLELRTKMFPMPVKSLCVILASALIGLIEYSRKLSKLVIASILIAIGLRGRNVEDPRRILGRATLYGYLVKLCRLAVAWVHKGGCRAPLSGCLFRITLIANLVPAFLFCRIDEIGFGELVAKV